MGYEIGSVWTHNTIGTVTVIRQQRIASPPDAYCGTVVWLSPVIRDNSGREWSCYSPHIDLTPATPAPASEEVC